jgi:large subunit ribosomal protein L21e
LSTFRIGDIVDIKASGKIHKGMPHKNYHGKTGIVWNVTPRAVGVILNKRVNTRIVQKKIHVRIEHLKKSTSRDDFLARRRDNDAKRAAAKKEGKKISLKRVPEGPRASFTVPLSSVNIQTLKPAVFEELF